MKDCRKVAFDYTRNRQGNNREIQRQRNKQIMIKLKRSQKQVEEFMRNQNHELMLKQELRKLRTDDIVKKKIREKRKDAAMKQQIIDKEQNNEMLLKSMRDREDVLIKTRHMNMMKNNMDKINHIDKLD